MAEPMVVADQLSRVYGSGDLATYALREVSFTIEAGEFVGIVGRSGSGKSTLLNQLGLLDTPTSGRLTLDGRDGAAVSPAARARMRNELLGFVFQYHHLLPEFTVLENVLMPSYIAGKTDDPSLRTRATETLEVLGLGGLGAKNANALSGGQKQRVAIGRALINRPPIILADEPTGNLDTENTEAVYDLFRTINREWGTTFLIVTHDSDIASMTDRIIELRDGKLVQDVADPYASR